MTKANGKKTKSLGKITLEDGNSDVWICTCGNTADSDGFRPCDEKGRWVEPTPAEWKKPLYICDNCANIIDQDTLEIVGIADKDTVKKNLFG